MSPTVLKHADIGGEVELFQYVAIMNLAAVHNKESNSQSAIKSAGDGWWLNSMVSNVKVNKYPVI